MYNRYQGNTGRFIRLPEPFERNEQAAPAPCEPEREQDEYIRPPQESRRSEQSRAQAQNRPPQNKRQPQHSRAPQSSRAPQNSRAPQSGRAPQTGRRAEPRHESQLESLLGGLGGTLSGRLSGLDTEDILLLAVIYLMYRESGDKQLLIVMAALLFL